VVRSHYGKDVVLDGEKIYRAANALGDWLGLDGGWADIANMQRGENIAEFRQMLRKAT
jgi:hypothetical protein